MEKDTLMGKDHTMARPFLNDQGRTKSRFLHAEMAQTLNWTETYLASVKAVDDAQA